jgi:quercetin dioxygenase-like cupin family protein
MATPWSGYYLGIITAASSQPIHSQSVVADDFESQFGNLKYGISLTSMTHAPSRECRVTVLYEDPKRGEMTCLLKLEPGAHIPFHKHPEIEQSFVLEGSVEDHDGIAMAGDYVWRKSGSLHDNKSPGGAVLFAVYRKPNIYYHTAKETPGF